jgi:hypothetical protein
MADGVSLRNFIYSDFDKQCRAANLDLTYLNPTPFNLDEMGMKSVTLTHKPTALTDLYKRAKINLELKAFANKFNNNIYYHYIFKSKIVNVKQLIKRLIVWWFEVNYKNKSSVLFTKMQEAERRGSYYKQCKLLFEKEKPNLLFCTSQRAINAIAPVVAAKDLGIPTACFIYSWDNLPKATLILNTDYFFVWSNYMKNELLEYYPHINHNQIIVTGTPQFEIHFEKKLKQTRQEFFKSYGLDPTKKYLCFSGDDVTTSPHDPQYLEDVARVVRTLNQEQDNWRIIFRRCPVDFSNRYDQVLQDYATEITPIAPKWQRLANSWDAVLPLQEDNALLLNTVAHCELVINLGSSMVFDAACQGTPCAYIAYNPEGVALQKDVHTIYKYLHFQSMPKEPPVFWLKKPDDLKMVLSNLGAEKVEVLQHARQWFEIINYSDPQQASQRMVHHLKKNL